MATREVYSKLRCLACQAPLSQDGAQRTGLDIWVENEHPETRRACILGAHLHSMLSRVRM